MYQRSQTPLLATDVIVEIGDKIVLVGRRNAPHGWALPGGFVDRGEKVEDAAVREIKEETGLDVSLEQLLGIYSDPRRDPRQHVVSVVYIGQASGEPISGDDAAEVALFAPHALPPSLCFDHQRIIADYLHFRQTGELPAPQPSSPLEE